MKRALIFDFGGVIMKTRDFSPRHAWDERLGLPHGSVEKVVHGSSAWRQAQRGEISLAAYWDAVAAQLGLDTAQVAQLAVDFCSGDQVDHEVIDCIRQLRGQGHSIALLSNDSPALEEKLHDLNLYSLFDVVLISGQIGVMKPDQRAFLDMLSALDRPADECVFIDDMRVNVEGARALGILALHYIDGIDLEAALAPLLIIEHS
jgi:putative hydrolase of the HAD superfamily